MELAGDGHGSTGLRLSALYTIEFPDSVRVNQTESIRYSFFWHPPNGTATYSDADAPFMEGRAYPLLYFVPDESNVPGEDKRFVAGIADLHSPHTGTYCKIGVPYSANGTTGSVDIRLDRPLHHDRNVIQFREYHLQTPRTGDGAPRLWITRRKRHASYPKTAGPGKGAPVHRVKERARDHWKRANRAIPLSTFEGLLQRPAS